MSIDSEGFFSEMFKTLASGVGWIFKRENRLRLQGCRIEVIALILTRKPVPSVLLGQSPYHNMWMPPQEGVQLKEDFDTALRRCLSTECNLAMPKDGEGFASPFHLRTIQFAGIISLPESRHKERPVADNIAGNLLEYVKLKSKAYWTAKIIVDNRESINARPDGRELLDIKWFELADAVKIIGKTNHPEKAKLLINCLRDSRRDLFGADLAEKYEL